MGEVRFNAKTFEAVRLEDNEWVDTPVKYNKKSGARVAWDGDSWATVGKLSGRHKGRAEGMTPDELMVAQTKNDPFGNYLRTESAKPQQGESPDENFKRLYGNIPKPARPGVGETALRGFAQGGLLGHQDELTAGVLAAKDAATGDMPFTDSYKQRLMQQRTKLRQGREDSPVTAYGSEFAGSIAPALLPMLNFTKGGQYGNALKSGATMGGIYGFGSSEGGPLDHLKGTATGAVAGGGAGTLLAGAGKGIQAVAQHRAEKAAAQSTGMSLPQWKYLNQTISADVASGSGKQFLGPRRPEGVLSDAMIADAGSATASGLDTAIIKSPMAANVAAQNVGGRAAQQNVKLGGALDETLGSPQGLRRISRDISQSTAEGRHGAYTSAYETPINYASPAGRKIEEALSRIDGETKAKAFKQANARMLAEGKKNDQIMFSYDAKTGVTTVSNPPNTIQLDYTKRALDTMGRESMDAMGNRTGDSVMWTGLARDLRNAVKEAVPDYGRALAVGKDKIDQDQALALGSKLLNPKVTREVVEDMTDGMSDESRRAMAAGFRSFIDEKIANVKSVMSDPDLDPRQARDALLTLSSQATRDKITMISGKEASNKLFNQLDESMIAFGLKARVAKNSETARRTIATSAADQLEGAGIQESLRTGGPKAAIGAMWRAVAERTPTQKQLINDELYMNIVKSLTGPKGAEALDLFQKIMVVQPNPKMQAIVNSMGEASRIGATATGAALSDPAPKNDYLLKTGQ